MDAPPPLPPAAGGTGPPDAGRLIGGRYRLEARIAGGGMASVWEAVDEVLARRVAVKLLHPHLAADEQFVARFRREAVAAARLAHPSIVSIFDTCSDGATEAIVMELVRGTTLRDELDRRGTFDPISAATVVAEVADALAAAHAAGIVHRDVKPANVLLSHDGRVLVVDFGIAKAIDELDHTGAGTTLGTAKYLAPEQVEGRPVDGRTDVYGAGVILYELLCGRPPFAADTEAATALARLHRDPEPPRSLQPSIPAPLESIVLRALARDPDQRLPSATALRDALRAFARGVPVDLGPAGVAGAGASVDPTNVVLDPTRASPPLAPPPILPPPPMPLGGGPAAWPARPPAPPSSPSPAQPSRRRRRVGLAITSFLVFGAAAVALVLYLQAGSDDPGNGGGAFTRGGDGPEVAALSTFDPDGDDGVEKPELVDLVVDGDPATAWQSSCYRSQAFGGLKDGVGIIVELAAEATIGEIVLESPIAGWNADIHVADEAADALDGWGPVLGTVEDADVGETTIELDGAEGRFALVLFTALGAEPFDGCDEFPFAVAVGELTLR